MYKRQYINSTPSNESKKIYSSTDIVATIAHELAHYLGLFHTFSESDDEGLNTCMDTDYCDELQPMIEKHIAIGCKVISNQRTA